MQRLRCRLSGALICSARCAGDLFVPFMFLMFNGGDLLGRGLASLGPWAEKPPSTAILLTYALGRVALLVGLMFCNVITPHQWRLPRLIRSVTSRAQRLAGSAWSSMNAVACFAVFPIVHVDMDVFHQHGACAGRMWHR